MSSTYHEQWSQNSKLAFAPILELGGITSNMCSELARHNLRMMNEMMQASAEQMQNLSRAKGLEEALRINSQYTAKIAPQMLHNAQYVLDTMLDSANQYQQWFEKSTEQFQKQGKEVVEKVKEHVQSCGQTYGHKKHQHHYEPK